jgi:mono/diheme cytochrome c family protein
MFMFKRFFLLLIVLIIIAMMVITVMYYRPAIDPVAPPAHAAFSPQLIEQGATLAGIGNCAACHTSKGGPAFAGGLAMETPFGKIYATNITPDPVTGIGSWSQAAFKRAMHEGVRRDGAHLFPAFPYTHFTIINDADLTALYAFLMTRVAVNAPAKEATIPFPLNIRAFQAGWKLLYFKPGMQRTDAARSMDWNRGRYLAEGLAHCAACHTPRNKLGAEITDSSYTGASIKNWFAPALTSANKAPIPWDEKEIYSYLRTGISVFHGNANGPMSEVVHDGLMRASDGDIHALAAYFVQRANVTPQVTANSSAALVSAMSRANQVEGQYHDRGANLYLVACASCHSNSDGIPVAVRPELGLNSAVWAADPSNLLQVILHGVGRSEGMQNISMPGFAQTMTDEDVARIAAYLRSSRTTEAPWPDLVSRVATLRSSATE